MLGQSEGEDLNVVSLTEFVKKSYVAQTDTCIVDTSGCGQWREQPDVPSEPAVAS